MTCFMSGIVTSCYPLPLAGKQTSLGTWQPVLLCFAGASCVLGNLAFFGGMSFGTVLFKSLPLESVYQGAVHLHNAFHILEHVLV